jgi:pimeloyl-ACP methyl ester carboxylesterase
VRIHAPPLILLQDDVAMHRPTHPVPPETLQIQITGDSAAPTVIYLPGLHGDWTLLSSFRAALGDRARLVEFTYPRTLTWTLAEYAREVSYALLDLGITNGWLLAESFGSQVAWQLLALERSRSEIPGSASPMRTFHTAGLIVSAGFVKHPIPLIPKLGSIVVAGTPLVLVRQFLRLYALYARFRHRHAPETLLSVSEFVARRTELDRQAMTHRIRLIIQNDPRPIARTTCIPVYWLMGSVDPIVPWPWSYAWIRENCPGFLEGKLFWSADHNVLGTAPQLAAEQVVRWIGSHATPALHPSRSPPAEDESTTV